MTEDFARIEGYINNTLSDSDKKAFEKELKTNSTLSEQYDFYKNLQKQQTTELKPISFDKKILPEINNINFTEKNLKSSGSKGAIVGLLILFVAVTSYLFIVNQSKNNALAIIQNKVDSIQYAYQNAEKELNKTRQIALEQAIIAIDEKSSDEENIKKQLEEKEKEIAALKSGTNDERSTELQKEIEVLKNELAKVKQELYENTGNYANENTDNKSISLLKKEIRTRYSGSNLRIEWKGNAKYRIKIYNSNKNLVYSSPKYISNNELSIEKPANGHYYLYFYPDKGKRVDFLLVVNADKVKVWFDK